MMSRGLGKIEKAILEAMQARPKRQYWTSALCVHVYSPGDYCQETGEYRFNFKPNNSQIKSVLRACKSLERKGYIKATKKIHHTLNGHEEHGGRTHSKDYVLKSSQNNLDVNT